MQAIKTRAFLSLLGLSLLTGCGVHAAFAPDSESTTAVSGHVHGGEQPVSGATLQMYTVGTGGDGSTATTLLPVTNPITTDANGGFNITNQYSCANATEVYLVATGGDPQPGTTNANIALMAALGPCSNLSAGTNIVVNELTTVAAVSSLAPYMSSIGGIGSGTSDVAGLTAAFTTANELVNTSTGSTPGTSALAGMTVPISQIDTLADIVALCINSGGVAAGSNSTCGALFNLTTVGNSTPADTITALLNLAKNPTLSTYSLWQMASTSGPFQPILTAQPPSFAVLPVFAYGTVAIGGQGVVSLTSPVDPNPGLTASYQGSVSGPNAEDFSVAGCTTKALPCVLTVTFSPQASGVRTATLTVTWTAYYSIQYSTSHSLQGTGTTALTPGLSMTPTNFGPIVMGSVSGYPVTLTNSGDTTLNLGTPTFSGANPADFSYYTPLCSTLTVGASCSFQMKLTGGQPGAQTANIAFTDSNTGTTFTFALSDNVTVPPTATPNPLVFPATQIGASSSPLSLTVTTYLNHPVTAQYIGTDGGQTPSFTLTKSSCVQGESPCLITAVFTPTRVGMVTDAIELTDSVTGVSAILYVEGSGGLGTASVSTSSLSFTGTSRTTSAAQAVILSNTGTASFAITSIALSGTNAGEFTSLNNCGSSLAANSQCTINVSFAPQTPGSKIASLTLSGDANAGLPLSVGLSGTAQ